MTSLVTKYLQTDVGNIAYYFHQNALQPTVNLYIHGLGDSRKWFLTHFNTYSLDRFSWIVPDLLGHGDSSKTDQAEDYTMEQQAKYLISLLEKEQVKQFSILAHSMGGPIAISLIELLACNEAPKPIPELLLYLEGNLDAGDAFFSSFIAKKTFSEFEKEFESICRKILDDSQEQHMIDYVAAFREAGPFPLWASSNDLAQLSEEGNLLSRLLALRNLTSHFVFGEKNKGALSSEKLVRDTQLPMLYIPEAGHGLHTENPSYFWETIGKLIQR